MADEPPSLMTWARSQMRRKPASDDAPGTGGGFRLSRGLMIAIVLSCVVVVLVLTSDNGGTPTTTSAESPSPGASTESVDPAAPPSGDAAASAPSSVGGPSASQPPAAVGNPADRSKPVGTTAFTRDRQALTVRSQPNYGGSTVATLGYDTPLTLVCHTQGPVVYGMNALRSSLWVKVVTPGSNTGYGPDAWIATEAEVPTLVPAC